LVEVSKEKIIIKHVSKLLTDLFKLGVIAGTRLHFESNYRQCMKDTLAYFYLTFDN